MVIKQNVDDVNIALQSVNNIYCYFDNIPIPAVSIGVVIAVHDSTSFIPDIASLLVPSPTAYHFDNLLFQCTLFTLVVNNAFRDQENYSHEDVFGHLKTELFSAEDAAQYLEVSLPTLRRLVQSQKLKPKKIVGRSQLFSTTDLKQLKRQIKKTR